MDATASALGFYLFGFAFAYGDDASADGLNPAGNAFIGKNFFAMDNMAPTAYYNWVFQWTVCHVQPMCRLTVSLLQCAHKHQAFFVLVLAPEAGNTHAADKTWQSEMMQSVDADCFVPLHCVMLMSCVL